MGQWGPPRGWRAGRGPVNRAEHLSCVPQVPIDHSDLVADLLKELSNHNERVEERKGALLELLKITREDSLGVWEEHFKTILLLLLETLGDKDVSCPPSCLSWSHGSPPLCAMPSVPGPRLPSTLCATPLIPGPWLLSTLCAMLPVDTQTVLRFSEPRLVRWCSYWRQALS